jgi:hypothetical protein
MPDPKDKAEEEKQPRPKKPPGYRKFEKLLKRVVTAPPLKRSQEKLTPDHQQNSSYLFTILSRSGTAQGRIGQRDRAKPLLHIRADRIDIDQFRSFAV